MLCVEKGPCFNMYNKNSLIVLTKSEKWEPLKVEVQNIFGIWKINFDVSVFVYEKDNVAIII